MYVLLYKLTLCSASEEESSLSVRITAKGGGGGGLTGLSGLSGCFCCCSSDFLLGALTKIKTIYLKYTTQPDISVILTEIIYSFFFFYLRRKHRIDETFSLIGLPRRGLCRLSFGIRHEHVQCHRKSILKMIMGFGQVVQIRSEISMDI